MKTTALIILALGLPQCVVTFTAPQSSSSTSYLPSQTLSPTQPSSSTALNLSDKNDPDSPFMRWNKQKRAAGVGDRIVDLKRPLGIVLEEDEDGNVYVDAVAPKGNAARTGMVKEGDIVTMCSATFGDQMWNCRGVGLTRVLAAIRVRAGPNVKLVFESTNEKNSKWENTAKSMAQAEEARKRAQAKKDDLLSELEDDEKKVKRGFFGLF